MIKLKIILTGILMISFILGFGQNRPQKKRKMIYQNGNTYTREECRIKYEQYIKNIELKKGDIVADVGGASGWVDGALSVLTDSVKFYIEDINEEYLKKLEFEFITKYYSEIKQSAQTNTFQFVIGSERGTNLPDTFFNKIMLNNSLHEFTYVDEMIKDLYLKLKPDGKLIIDEYFSTPSTPKILKGCLVVAYKQEEIIDLMSSHGLYITNKMLPENNSSNILVFEKNKTKSENYISKKEKFDNYLRKIDLLDSLFIIGDSGKISAVSDSLMLKRMDLIEVYSSFELWLNDYGYNFYYDDNFKSAISIFKMNVRLFPDSYNVYDSLGDAYLGNKEKELALLNFAKALELYPENVAEKQKLEKLKKEIENK